jgi:hypothetical protein
VLENLTDFHKIWIFSLENTNEGLTFRDRTGKVDNSFDYLEHRPYALLKEKFSEGF